MQAIYQANIEELDENFLQGLKNLFRGEKVKLIVFEMNPSQTEWNNEEDEVWNHVTSR